MSSVASSPRHVSGSLQGSMAWAFKAVRVNSTAQKVFAAFDRRRPFTARPVLFPVFMGLLPSAPYQGFIVTICNVNEPWITLIILMKVVFDVWVAKDGSHPP